MSKIEFDDIVESVRVAIEMGTHPKLIAQGSSGSYFARNTEGKTVAVFKPKDEEPYASRNPNGQNGFIETSFLLASAARASFPTCHTSQKPLPTFWTEGSAQIWYHTRILYH